MNKPLKVVKHLSGQHNQSSHGRGKGGNVTLAYYDPEEVDYANDPYSIAKETGIYVSRDKEPTRVATDGYKIVGALFTATDYSDGEFSFDVAVSPDYQGQGIGSKLVDEAISSYQSEAWDFPGMVIRVNAVNPQMVKMLAKRGFTEEGSTGSGVEMLYEE